MGNLAYGSVSSLILPRVPSTCFWNSLHAGYVDRISAGRTGTRLLLPDGAGGGSFFSRPFALRLFVSVCSGFDNDLVKTKKKWFLFILLDFCFNKKKLVGLQASPTGREDSDLRAWCAPPVTPCSLNHFSNRLIDSC